MGNIEQINLRVSPELREKIEKARGGRSRNAFLVDVVERFLGSYEAPAVERVQESQPAPVDEPPVSNAGAVVYRGNQHHPLCACAVCKDLR